MKKWLKKNWALLIAGISVAIFFFVLVAPLVFGATTSLYSDALSGNVTCDGYVVGQNYPLDTWSTLVTKPLGENAYTSANIWTGCASSYQSGKWQYLFRGFMDFDLTSIISNKNITAGNFTAHCYTWEPTNPGNYSFSPVAALYAASPLLDNALSISDYPRVAGTSCLSNSVAWSTNEEGWAGQNMTFTLNEYALVLINRALVADAPIFHLSILYTVDAINEAPVWANFGHWKLKLDSVEAVSYNRPSLNLTYADGEPTAEQLEGGLSDGDGGDGGDEDDFTIPGVGDVKDTLRHMLDTFGMDNQAGYWVFLLLVEIFGILATIKSPKVVKVFVVAVIFGLWLVLGFAELYIIILLGVVAAGIGFTLFRKTVAGGGTG